jgi:hypothetical protein
LLFAALVLTVSTIGPAYADQGRKPTMQFNVRYSMPCGRVIQGQLLQSYDPDCADAKPLAFLGPQGVHIGNGNWSAIAYGFSKYAKLVVQFQDKTRSSNVFTKVSTDAVYTVDVRADDLFVVEQKQMPWRDDIFEPRFGEALKLTLFIELIIGTIYALCARQPLSLVAWIFVGNMLTLPVVWFVFPNLHWPEAATIAMSEVFAWLAEAGFLHVVTRRKLSLRTALILSFAMNLASGLMYLLV